MPLTVKQLTDIAACLADCASVRAGITAVRDSHPGLRVTCCDASDVDGESPFQNHANFDVYLVDSSSHCWQLTGDPQRATGIVLAGRQRG